MKLSASLIKKLQFKLQQTLLLICDYKSEQFQIGWMVNISSTINPQYVVSVKQDTSYNLLYMVNPQHDIQHQMLIHVL